MSSAGQSGRSAERKVCEPPFKFTKKASLICDLCEDTQEAIECCTEKFFLFMGHQTGVENQKARIEELLEDVKKGHVKGTSLKDAVITLDYKMKFNAMYHRERTVDYCGKSDFSWHGSMTILWHWESDSNEPTLQQVYFD